MCICKKSTVLYLTKPVQNGIRTASQQFTLTGMLLCDLLVFQLGRYSFKDCISIFNIEKITEILKCNPIHKLNY